MLISIDKQSGESVESVLKKKKNAIQCEGFAGFSLNKVDPVCRFTTMKLL